MCTVEAYDAPRQAGGIALAMRVHDAADGHKVFEFERSPRGKAADRANGFRADVPLKGWSPGHYVLEVEATASRRCVCPTQHTCSTSPTPDMRRSRHAHAYARSIPA